MESHAEAVIL